MKIQKTTTELGVSGKLTIQLWEQSISKNGIGFVCQ
jgi:hypothetical protein